MKRWLRHTMFSRDPAALAEQCGENARDTNEALDRKVTGYLKTVARYSATGDTETRLAIAVGPRPPFAIILARANETLNPSAPVACVPILNFYFVRGEYGVFEPYGLTADTLYDLTFLVLE